MSEASETALAQVEERQSEDVASLDSAYSTQELQLRLSQMGQKLDLLQSFFRQVMKPGVDYGIIPGTERPTLLKPGAEKMAEFYGYSITVRDLRETIDRDTGYYRAIVTVALVNKRTGAIVAEGVGEANTMESRYRIRWVPEFKLPSGIDVSTLQYETRKRRDGKGQFKVYRVINDDPWSLWNTVLKMSKKRAMIDAILSATRSSGLFTQDLEDLQEWANEGALYETEATTDGAYQAQTIEPKPAKSAKHVDDAIKARYAALEKRAANAGRNRKTVLGELAKIVSAEGVTGLTDLSEAGWAAFDAVISGWERESEVKLAGTQEFTQDEMPF